MKKLILIINLIFAICILCSCSLYDKEYISVEEYKITQNVSSLDDKKLVTDFEELKESVLTHVYSGYKDGLIDFSEKYDGNPEEDLENACWQVKSRDALCAYCVNNISYKLYKVVSYYQASISIKYESTAIPLNEIHRIQYSTGIEDIISTTLYNSDKRVGILIEKSLFSVNDVENLIKNVYFENPLLCPVYPQVDINLFSGSNSQRFYEINFNYMLTDNELQERKKQLSDISLFSDDIIGLDEKDKADLIISKLSDDIIVEDKCSVYDALINKYSDSQGIALAFKSLANALDLESYIVSGLKFGNEYYWNIIKINNEYYHVVIGDPSLYYVSDEVMWSSYRWNVSDYPSCHNSLQYTNQINVEDNEDGSNILGNSYHN